MAIQLTPHAELEFQRHADTDLPTIRGFSASTFFFGVADTFPELAEMLNPCPCFKYQA